MTTRELHIGIDLELQEINTQAKKGLLSQEKDWFLNREIDNYINSKLTKDLDLRQKGFQNDIKRLEDIEELVKTSPILAIKNNKVILPSDLLKFINVEAYIDTQCGGSLRSQKITKYKCVFSIDPTDSINVSNYSINLITDSGTQEVFNINTLPNNYLNSIEFDKQKFLLIQALKIRLKESIDKSLNSSTSLYWERIGDEYYPSSFILISDVPFSGINVTMNNTMIPNSITSYIDTIYDEENLISIPTRVVNQEFHPFIQKSNLSKANSNSAVATYKQGVLHFDTIEGVVIKGVKITYVLKPRLVDLLLNSNSELSRSNLKKIISNTVQFLKALLTDDNYQAYAKENILIE